MDINTGFSLQERDAKMKKLINNPDRVVEEMLEGLVMANNDKIRLLDGENIVIRKEAPVKGKVALVSGGGSGHEPAHAGYVGEGMLDAACAGAVFTSPTPNRIVKAIKAVDGGSGVLLVVKNFAGDVMNFEMAAEMTRSNGTKVSKVIVNDDVSINDVARRRGIAGTVFVHKIAGAKAELGGTLEETQKIAEKVIANVRSMGVALTSCTLPKAGKPTFTLGDGEVELGVGIHGEKGIQRSPLKSADEFANIIVEKLIKDLSLKLQDEVAVMINGLGGTPLMELCIIYRRVAHILQDLGVRIFKSYIGEYMTSLEMAGCSVTFLRLDEEFRKLLLAPANVPAFCYP